MLVKENILLKNPCFALVSICLFSTVYLILLLERQLFYYSVLDLSVKIC